MGHINKSNESQKYGFLSFVISTKSKVFGVCQGAQIFRPIDFGLLTSQIKKAFARHNGLVALQLLAVLAGGFLSLLSFSNSAYAASYVNVSSGGSGETAGVVSLGKIKPSSSGSTATGNDTLTVHTDCSAGYKVYVSGQNGKTTNLTNQSAEYPTNPSSSDIISASSNTIASPNTLSSNTWGISGSSTDIENHLYAGLPAYADATSTALVTKTNVEEESTVPIYYGVKADTTLNPGTYSGDILYTVLMDTSCIPYTVEFNPNVEDESEITGEMAAQSILPNSATALTANAYEREGYTFLGWSTTPEGKTGNVTNGIGTTEDVDYDNEAEVTNLTTSGSSITLYAIWEVAPTEYMQDFMCSSLGSGKTKTLVDKRDGQEYTVYRIPTDNAATNVAGKCIMTKDLNLGAVASVEGSSSTIVANGTMTLSPEDSTFTTPSGSGESITVPTSNVTVSMAWNTSDSYSNRHYHTNGTGDYAGRGYYSWGAAMVACPKGWRLPTSDELNNNGSWNSSTTGISKVVNNNISTIQSSPWSFVLGGRYYNNGFGDAGSHGYYWSSTQNSSSYSYILNLDSSVGLQRYNYNKRTGYAVRCMADDYDNTMQDFDSSSLSEGETMKLKDKRDDAIYTVKKFSDGTVWMTSNLILGHDKGYALTNELTNIPNSDTSTYYFPMAGRRGSLSSDSTIESSNTTTPTFNGTNENQAHVQYRAAGRGGDQGGSGTLSQSTGYYNFWAASLGYSGYQQGSSSGNTPRDICPKGWQLPLGGSNTTKSWVSLDKALNGSSAGSNRTDATARDRFLNDAGFLYSGYYQSSILYYVGSQGNWWSSTVGDTFSSYNLHLDSSGYVRPQTNDNKFDGLAVRCVAQDSATITFDANGGTGEMGPQRIYENDATLKSNTFTRDGYAFIGWSEDASATTATYTNGASVSDLVSRGGNVTLYAIWVKIDGDMQGWFGCGKISEGDVARLRDTRDNKVYTVKKLPDGKCWMMQNLTIGSDGAKTLTSADTNIDNNTTYYLPPAGKQGSSTIDNSSTLTATTTANFINDPSTDPHAKTQFRTKDSSVTNDSDTGYYNFYTATLGYSYYGANPSSGTSTRDICPKGWRLPKTTDNGSTVSTTGTANDFTNLVRRYSTNWSGTATSYNYYTTNSTAINSMYGSAAYPLATSTANNYAGFSYAGLWNGTSSSASNVGSNGYYWSASVYETGNGYYLYFDSSNVYPQRYDFKSNGFAVRCVAKYNDVSVDIDGTMQDFDGSSLTNVGDSAKLMDTRDSKVYTVKKLSDDKVWMVENLTISATGMVADSLDNTNTNIPSSDTSKYYLPPQNTSYRTAGSINNSAVKTASSAVNFTNGSYSRYPQVGYRAAGTTDNYTGNAVPENTAYYNFYTASLGFSYSSDGKTSGSSPRDICPKGWRLPWVSDVGTTQNSSYGTASTSGDFVTLAKSYNSSASWTNTNTYYNYYTSDSTIRQNMVAGDSGSLDRFMSNGAAGFTYAGYYNNTTLNYVGTYGYYWSSSVYNTNGSYDLGIGTTSVAPQGGGGKEGGFAVRCIAGTRS